MKNMEWSYGDECPECGNDSNFRETCEAHGYTRVDEYGNAESFECIEYGDPIVIICDECEKELINKLDD